MAQSSYGWEVFTSQEYPVNAGVLQGTIHGPITHFLLHITDLPVDIICYILIYDDDNTLYSNCDQEASDMRQQLELTSEFESDL